MPDNAARNVAGHPVSRSTRDGASLCHRGRGSFPHPLGMKEVVRGFDSTQRPWIVATPATRPSPSTGGHHEETADDADAHARARCGGEQRHGSQGLTLNWGGCIGVGPAANQAFDCAAAGGPTTWSVNLQAPLITGFFALDCDLDLQVSTPGSGRSGTSRVAAATRSACRSRRTARRSATPGASRPSPAPPGLRSAR